VEITNGKLKDELNVGLLLRLLMLFLFLTFYWHYSNCLVLYWEIRIEMFLATQSCLC